MKPTLKRLLFCLLVFSSLSAVADDVKITFSYFKVAKERIAACRIIFENVTPNAKKGVMEINDAGYYSFNLLKYHITLQGGESKTFDIPLKMYASSYSVKTTFENEERYFYIDSANYEDESILDIRAPGREAIEYTSSDSTSRLPSVNQRKVAELPTNFFCYMGLSLIVLPASQEPLLSVEQHQALSAYVLFGGSLLILSENNTLSKHWVNLNKIAHGKVYLQEPRTEILTDPYTKPNTLLLNLSSSAKYNPREIFPAISTDRLAFLIILILGIIVIVPVNYYVLKKTNARILIFVTMPVASLILSLLLISTFFIKEGFYKAYQGVSFSVFSEEAKSLFVMAQDQLYHSTMTKNIPTHENEFFFTMINAAPEKYLITVDKQKELSGGYTKSRALADFTQLGLYPCESTIEILSSDQQYRVKNHFGVPQEIHLFDRKSQRWYGTSSKKIGPGDEVTLTAQHDINKKFLKENNFESLFFITFDGLKKKDYRYIFLLISDEHENIQFTHKNSGYLQFKNYHVVMGGINE